MTKNVAQDGKYLNAKQFFWNLMWLLHLPSQRSHVVLEIQVPKQRIQLEGPIHETLVSHEPTQVLNSGNPIQGHEDKQEKQ